MATNATQSYSSMDDLNKSRTSSIVTSTVGSATHTDRGTKIVSAEDSFDKNSFLKILSAQLSNQDPTQQTDSSQYITQMAQFASMEQMSNLNETMTNSANQNLVGKGVTIKADGTSSGTITGIVQTVTKSTSGTRIAIKTVDDSGNAKYYDADVSDVISTVVVDETGKALSNTLSALSSLNGNMSFLLASGFMDKNVEYTAKDDKGNTTTANGVVKGVYKKNGDIYCNVEVGEGNYKEVLYSDITKVGDFSTKTETE